MLQDGSTQLRHPDRRSLMPIMMSYSRFGWWISNIINSTFRKIKEELQRGYLMMTRDIGKANFEWSRLFEPFPYKKMYDRFVQISLTASDEDELRDWVGWVKSRFQSLLLKEDNGDEIEELLLSNKCLSTNHGRTRASDEKHQLALRLTKIGILCLLSSWFLLA